MAAGSKVTLESFDVRSELVKIIECPRDAWQAMPQMIPAAVKADYLRALAIAGFRHIDAVSFVSPRAVPQMADSEEVLALLSPIPDVEIIGIVVNKQGAERAVRTQAVQTLGFPYSLSPTFLERNQKQTQQEALHTLEEIHAQARQAGLRVVAYISMAFGNPYGEPWQQEDVVHACRALHAMGISEISLADTVGAATPQQITALLATVLAEVPGVEVGAHLHTRPDQARAATAAVYAAGCHRLDVALGGQGGCPFAQDTLVGNLATEQALAELRELGASLPRLQSLDAVLAMGRDIALKYGAAIHPH